MYKLIEPQSCNIVAHAQLFQAHLYLFSALPKGAAPPMPLVLFKACKDVSAFTFITRLAEQGTQKGLL